MFRISNRILPILILAQGAAAQQGIIMRAVSATPTSFTFGAPGGPTADAPTPGVNGTFKTWDATNSSASFFSPTLFADSPQIAVGPDDIFTTVNRTIARYPNPNAPGNSGAVNPLNYPPTELTFIDVWMGPLLLTTVCPAGSFGTCVLDNVSIRYDQMQGRFLVLLTATDIPAHRSNFVLIVSRRSLFTQCPSPPTATCPPVSPIFTTPVKIDNPTVGFSTADWFYYTVPINLGYIAAPTSTIAGMAALLIGDTLSAPFCSNGGPQLPLTVLNTRSCTNYFPTDARMGLDNDHVTLVAPVLDQMSCTADGCNTAEGTLAAPGASLGPYAGTRVVTIPKLAIYNAIAPVTVQPPACGPPGICGVVNLTDNMVTGTLTGVPGCKTTTPRLPGACAAGVVSGALVQPIRGIFWEPAILRGRTLASFDSQIAPAATGSTAGVLTPLQYLVGHQVLTNVTATGNLIFFQPIVFSCRAGARAGSSGAPYCGDSVLGQTPALPVLGTQTVGTTFAGVITDPFSVRQGLSAAALVTQDGSSTVDRPLFVGDSRPAQVIFREGFFFEARTIHPAITGSPVARSAVLYDIFHKCPGPSGPAPCVDQEYQWFNANLNGNIAGFGFYAPMFDSTADALSKDPSAPVNVLPWLQKLFVGMTTGGVANTAGNFDKGFPSLWAFRPGDDAYDTKQPSINPYTGRIETAVTCIGAGACPLIPWSRRGGASTDPNDGSLWVYGRFAKNRLASIPGPGQWGTTVANYALNLPAPSKKDETSFSDVSSADPFFNWIQLARNYNLAQPTVLPGDSKSKTNACAGAGPSNKNCREFNPTQTITRAEAVYWIVRSQMDEPAITDFLCATGGDPSRMGCAAVPAAFTDLGFRGSNIDNPFLQVNLLNFQVITNEMLLRYIEVAARRGWIKACTGTNFCPNDPITRADLAVFLIRAKLGNTFPTSLLGIPVAPFQGDNLAALLRSTPFFSDVDPTGIFFNYIQAIRELGIANATGGTTFNPTGLVARQDIAEIAIRAFFL